MKRIGSFSLAIIVFTLSIVLCFPDISFADDATTLSKSKDNPFGYSSSEAQSYVSAHKDIYDSDHILLFSYTPTNTYNWTYSQVGKNSLHLSDNQLVAFLMSKKTITAYASMFVSVLSNNNVTRGLLSSVGIATTGDSDSLVNVMDKLTGNYNYLDALSYDEDSQTITMSNDNGSVDKLREEIKKYYYNSIGLKEKKSSGTVSSIIDSSDFRACFEYEEDYINAFGYKNYKYCLKTYYGFYYFFNDLKDYIYVSNDSNNDRFLSSYDNWTKETWRFRTLRSDGSTGFLQPVKEDTVIRYDFTLKVNVSDMYFWYTPSNGDWVLRPDWNNDYSKWVEFYSKDKTSLKFWASYSALYNYLHGDQNAYLSSKIEETGKDISYSIKDMNENLGTKMDELIDSINSGKGNMSADELQNAIDKGLEDLNKNTEDIKDNTSSILDKLEEQNQILLQILGVTEYIAYQTTKDDGSSYTKTDLINTINKIYNGLGNAILYGKNTLTDSGDSSGAASQSSIVTREDFKLSNNIYTSSGSGVSPGTPVVAYSLDDCSVYDDSNDYDVGIATQDINNMDIHDGLFGKFPFSVPYQLYEWLQVLQADPVAPKFVYNYGFLIGHKGEQKYDLIIDFSIYESWANECKSFLRLLFTLLMAVFIFRHFSNNKGGGVL
jgi:hypothetical protein